MTIKEYINQLEQIDLNVQGEEGIGDIVDNVKKIYGVKCDYFYAGDYDSPGYDCYYYLISFINEDGDLDGVDCQVESY